MLTSERDLATFVPLAFPEQGEADPAARLACLRHLHNYYLRYVAGPECFESIPRLNCDPLITSIEDAWMRSLDAAVDDAVLPRSLEEFREWFLQVSAAHAQPDFCAYLADDATLPEIALLVLAEELVDGRFDDLVALVQTGTQGAAKMVIADNYWDEMGRGNPADVHTTMFARTTDYMQKRLEDVGVVPEQLESAEMYGNASLLLMYGIYRHLTPRALGAMGVMEQSASPRFAAMVRGCERLSVPEDVIVYQRVHIDMDAAHGDAWFKEVLVPTAATSEAALREISLGVLTRIAVADAYYASVRTRMLELRQRSAA